jgi:hypothetical protein
MELGLGAESLLLRNKCESCPLVANNQFLGVIFYSMYKMHMRARNLPMRQLPEYYYLFLVFYLLHMACIEKCGVYWTEDEILLPPEEEWGRSSGDITAAIGIPAAASSPRTPRASIRRS